MRNNWIAVASAEHARRGRGTAGNGYMQVCHGKCAPLKRVLPGDRVVYCAPTLLLDQFEFVEVRSRWGYMFRFGLFKIGDGDMRLIAQAMQADLPSLEFDSLLF